MLLAYYGGLNAGDFAQETYETTSRDASRRSRALRKLGYEVMVRKLGWRMTGVGKVRLTLLAIRPGAHEHTFDLPMADIQRVSP